MLTLRCSDAAAQGLGVRVRRVILLLAACLLGATAQAAPKTDIVYFTNGDRLTGEIKGLDKGKLELSTSTAGTVDIEWDKVARIETGQYLEVETSGGSRYHGRPRADQQSGSIALASADSSGDAGVQRLAVGDVVRVTPIDQGSLLARLDGYVSAGFNYAKADNDTEFNFSAGVSSRDEVREWSLDGMVTLNSQSDQPTTSVYDLTLANKRFMKERWFAQFFGTVQGNQELGLDIREVLGAGMGRFLSQGANSEWSAVAGLAYDRENFRSEPAQNSLEAVFLTEYSFFQYDTPKRSLDLGLAVFPSLTESGRVRAEADIEARLELVEDLFFDLSVYGSYDSDADRSAPSNTDYGVVTSLGYSF